MTTVKGLTLSLPLPQLWMFEVTTSENSLYLEQHEC